MAKLNISYAILIIFTLFIGAQTNVHARKLVDEGDELAVDYICLKNEKLTKIHFYAHDVAGGPNATVYEVARAAISTDDLQSFGKVLVVDDMLTMGPAPDSGQMGRAQGIVVFADIHTPAPAFSFNVVFTSGKYNGSTLSIAGRSQLSESPRRLGVTGGSGVFRFSRGYAVVTTYSAVVGENNSYLVFEYTIYATYCPAPKM